jgi:hypothetical protein
MDEGKDDYVSRDSFDQEYEEEYPKWRKIILKFLSMEITSYNENDNTIRFFNGGEHDKILMRYDKENEHLWWNYTLQNSIVNFLPYGYVGRHFKYVLQDFFKKHFPQYGIKGITGANIG